MTKMTRSNNRQHIKITAGRGTKKKETKNTIKIFYIDFIKLSNVISDRLE